MGNLRKTSAVCGVSVKRTKPTAAGLVFCGAACIIFHANTPLFFREAFVLLLAHRWLLSRFLTRTVDEYD